MLEFWFNFPRKMVTFSEINRLICQFIPFIFSFLRHQLARNFYFYFFPLTWKKYNCRDPSSVEYSVGSLKHIRRHLWFNDSTSVCSHFMGYSAGTLQHCTMHLDICNSLEKHIQDSPDQCPMSINTDQCHSKNEGHIQLINAHDSLH